MTLLLAAGFGAVANGWGWAGTIWLSLGSIVVLQVGYGVGPLTTPAKWRRAVPNLIDDGASQWVHGPGLVSGAPRCQMGLANDT
jgi:uncharacterized protein YjeT (DUF2065 family)